MSEHIWTEVMPRLQTKIAFYYIFRPFYLQWWDEIEKALRGKGKLVEIEKAQAEYDRLHKQCTGI